MGFMMAFGVVMIFGSICGLLDTTAGLIIMILIAGVAGCASAWVLKKMIGVAIFFVSIGGGFFLGCFVYSFILAISGYEAFWLMICFAIGFMVAGGYLAIKRGKGVLIWATSFFGSYMFMRGWTYYFAGYPSEMQIYESLLQDGQDIELTNAFFAYMGVFAVAFIASIYTQKHVLNEEEEELAGHDDAFKNDTGN